MLTRNRAGGDASRTEKSAEPSDFIDREGRLFRADQASGNAKDRFDAGDDQQIAGTVLPHLGQQRLHRIAAGNEGRWPRRSRRSSGWRLLFDVSAIQLFDQFVELRIPSEFRHALPLFCYTPEVFPKPAAGRTFMGWWPLEGGRWAHPLWATRYSLMKEACHVRNRGRSRPCR